MKNNYNILTGAPGVGKTTLIEELKKLNIHCIAEPARRVLANQRAICGEALPEKNPSLFCKKLFEQSVRDYNALQNNSDLIIFDRGIADTIAYAGCFKLQSSHYEKAAQNYPYNKNVLVLPPWEEIYSTDDERKMNFSQVCEFHELICKAYQKLNYNLIEVPRSSVQERVQLAKVLLNF